MRKQKKLIKVLSLLVAILVIILLVLIVVDFGFANFIKGIFQKSQLVVIEDECGVVLGNLIHEIKSGDNCRIMCNNECGLLEKSFDKIEFIEGGNSCHKCNCYCR